MECEHVCRDCKWLSDSYTSACVNDASDHCADYVAADGTCPEWEGRTEYTCRTCRWYSGHSRSVCVHDASERLGQYVTPAETCPEWEGKRDELEKER